MENGQRVRVVEDHDGCDTVGWHGTVIDHITQEIVVISVANRLPPHLSYLQDGAAFGESELEAMTEEEYLHATWLALQQKPS